MSICLLLPGPLVNSLEPALCIVLQKILLTIKHQPHFSSWLISTRRASDGKFQYKIVETEDEVNTILPEVVNLYNKTNLKEVLYF